MEFKGIKGKWKIKNLINTGDTHVVTDTYRICDVKHFDTQIDKLLLEPSWDEGKANALLISKAPEMLEMLSTILKVSKEANGYCLPSWMDNEIEDLIIEATELP
ncbi:hypothetical protein [Chryseobacterium sp.]|uniref:hypothetical protein n=1 Tax=Chryseobacterium sp. TaxID=1871047 RepID=UPI00321BDE90